MEADGRVQLILKTMGIFFQPFVGRDYYSGGIFGKRIMVLGESHYCEEGCRDCGSVASHGECTSFTNGVVDDYLNENLARERWMNTFLKFERSLVGHETDWAERRRIWQSVMFYNYLQVAMGGPRQAGSGQQYDHAGHVFYEVIDEYLPQYIIAWGNRLWSYLPGDGRWKDGEPIIIGGYKINTGGYFLKNGRIAKIMAVNHPSVGYSWDWWHKAIKDFLK